MTTGREPGGGPSGGSSRQRRRGGLTAQFLLAVGHETAENGLTPSSLARAVTTVLPVDGAGVSTLVRGLRHPLGTSSVAAARAEELQTSLGEGPCLDAAQRQAPVVLDHPALMQRWPLYAKGLIDQTPFRAVASVPLRAPGGGVFAALDLYSTDGDLSGRLDLVEVDQHVAAPTVALLTTCVEQIYDVENLDTAPEWYQTAAGRRHKAWVAIGMVMAARRGPTSDALSLLRARARAQGRSLDDLAADIVDGRLPPTDPTD